MTRKEAIQKILSDVGEDDILVCSTGYISREVFEQKDRDLNFYVMGSMGNALAIGLGISLNVKNRVIVINGDGAALMGLGSLITAKDLAKPNLVHYILDNQCHESTGGQPTLSRLVNFRHLSKNVIVYPINKSHEEPKRINLEPKQITERFKNALLRQQKQS